MPSLHTMNKTVDDNATIPWVTGFRIGTGILPGKQGKWAFHKSDIPTPTPPTLDDRRSYSSHTWTSKDVYTQSVDIKLQAEGSYTGGFGSASMSATTNFLYNISTEANSVHFVLEGSGITPAAMAPLSDFQLSAEARKMATAAEFYATYGFSFISGYQLGSSIAAAYTASNYHEDRESDVMASIKASFNALEVSGSTSDEYKNAEKAVHDLSDTTVTFATLGTSLDLKLTSQDIAGVVQLGQDYMLDGKNVAQAGVPVVAVLTPFSTLPSWPARFKDASLPVVNQQEYSDLWAELYALDNLESNITQLRAVLSDDNLNGKVIRPRSNETVYYHSLAKQQAVAALDVLEPKVKAAIFNANGLNLLALPPTSVPDGYKPSEFTAHTLAEYYKSGNKRATQWKAYFSSGDLAAELAAAGAGYFQISSPVGNFNFLQVDTCSGELLANELKQGQFSKFIGLPDWRGYYHMYGMQGRSGVPSKDGSVTYINSTYAGVFGGPGGSSWNPQNFTLGPDEHIIHVKVQYANAEKGQTDHDVVLSLIFTTDLGNTYSNGTGDNRRANDWTDLAAPDGCCLHGFIAPYGDNAIEGFQVIWIPISKVPKVSG